MTNRQSYVPGGTAALARAVTITSLPANMARTCSRSFAAEPAYAQEKSGQKRVMVHHGATPGALWYHEGPMQVAEEWASRNQTASCPGSAQSRRVFSSRG